MRFLLQVRVMRSEHMISVRARCASEARRHFLNSAASSLFQESRQNNMPERHGLALPPLEMILRYCRGLIIYFLFAEFSSIIMDVDFDD